MSLLPQVKVQEGEASVVDDKIQLADGRDDGPQRRGSRSKAGDSGPANLLDDEIKIFKRFEAL